MKHIIGQSIFQIAVMMILLFFAPNIIPEYYDEFDKIL